MPGEQTGETPTVAGVGGAGCSAGNSGGSSGGGGCGGGGGGGDSQRSIPTPFLTKTYQLVDDPVYDELISWNEDGSTFVVWRPAEFARDLLPKYFKHNNFSSFVRQLNTYGFRKVVPDRWEFSNECFRRGEKILLRDIQRRKISQPAMAAAAAAATAAAVAASAVTVATVPVLAHAVSPSNSGEEQVISCNSSPAAAAAAMGGAVGDLLQRTTSCTTAPELMEENERLRKENLQLSQELTKLKGLYSNIYTLMANFTSGQSDCANLLPDGRSLDLLPGKQGMSEAMAMNSRIEEGIGLNLDEDLTPRLFGVSIGVKRARREEESGSAEEDNERREAAMVTREGEQGSDVKSEPMEENNSGSHNGRWLELGK